MWSNGSPVKNWLLLFAAAYCVLGGAFALARHGQGAGVEADGLVAIDRPTAARISFATIQGLEPDKWAALWLIRRHIDADAELRIHRQGALPASSVAFDTPDADYRRTARRSTFAVLSEAFDIENATAEAVGDIIHAIEINPWMLGADPLVSVVHQRYRALLDGRAWRSLPIPCALDFFDQVADAASAKTADRELAADDLAGRRLPQSCAESVGEGRGVETIAISDLLARKAAGEAILFVDARQPEEFREGHIPDARNLPLYSYGEAELDVLRSADLVVPYCLKDFRAYELARNLQAQGVKAVATMDPPGLFGWRSLDLPVTAGE